MRVYLKFVNSHKVSTLSVRRLLVPKKEHVYIIKNPEYLYLKIVFVEFGELDHT